MTGDDVPVLVWRGRAWRLSPELEPPEAARGAPVLSAADRRWVVVPGASPSALAGAGLDRFGAVLAPVLVEGWDEVAAGGGDPTLVPRRGHLLATSVAGVHPSDLPALDASAGRAERTALAVVGDAAVAARWVVRGALGYLPADPPPTEPVVDGWPATPLEDLDLLAYGTLQPGRERWPIVADLVEVAGPASVPGVVVATPMGWPAALLDRDDGDVHGTLLRPRGPEEARELYRRCDRVEDEGNLFLRRAAWTGSGWAAAYGWHPARGAPPGDVVPDGRWRP